MNTRLSNIGLALAVVLGFGIPGQGSAQSGFSVAPRGGVAIPVSDLADLSDVGASVGLGFAYDLTSRVSIRVDGDVDILSGADSGSSAPDMSIFHYGAGLSLGLIDPSSSRWAVDANLGAGASTFDSDSFSAGGTTLDFSETYFTTNGGVVIGYDLSPNVSLFAQGQAFLMFVDEDDTAVFSQISSEIDPAGFDTAWTIPVTAGVRLRF